MLVDDEVDEVVVAPGWVVVGEPGTVGVDPFVVVVCLGAVVGVVVVGRVVVGGLVTVNLVLAPGNPTQFGSVAVIVSVPNEALAGTYVVNELPAYSLPSVCDGLPHV